MTKRKNPWIPYLAVLGLLVIWFVYSQLQDRQYEVKIEPLFDFSATQVKAFTIGQDTMSVTLVQVDSAWSFAAPDTGSPARYKTEQFVKDVLHGQREGPVTSDSSRYTDFGVSGDKALRLTLKGEAGVLVTLWVGRSASDPNQEFVRYADDPKVYPSRQKMLNKLGTTASWWR